MLESGYYPPGAENDPRAPYNQVDPTPEKFDVDVCYVLTRSTKITSQDYIGGGYDEEGHPEAPEYQGNVKEDYEDQFLTPLQIMQEYAETCKMWVETYKKNHELLTPKGLKNLKHWNNVIASIEGWEEEFEPQ